MIITIILVNHMVVCQNSSLCACGILITIMPGLYFSDTDDMFVVTYIITYIYTWV